MRLVALVDSIMTKYEAEIALLKEQLEKEEKKKKEAYLLIKRVIEYRYVEKLKK